MLSTVLSKYRVDGPIQSPIRFLTIEDGGTDFSSEVEFSSYYNRPDEEFVWLPKEGDALTRDLAGPPAEYIAKIMSELLQTLGICNVDWGSYLENKLYRANEHNIKFYPIGRSTINVYPDWMRKSLNASKTEYEEQARIRRVNKFFSLFKEHPAKANIVFGAEGIWRDVFKSIYPDLHVIEADDYVRYAYSDSVEDTLIYAYFPYFRRLPGSKDQRASKVANYVAQHILKDGVTL